MATMRDMFDLLTDPIVEKKRILSPQNSAYVEELHRAYTQSKTIMFEQISKLEYIYDTHKREIWTAKN